ncbi:HORMA domain-containing protein 1-like [Acanthaster planci]|uniref:HORMA domain-containing protein 1-like n=1 Tax=Acanthaster planci TaxID=133434 RepID=A0A8B7XV93_ACAPL|nr:HORMA domain-containing protein 1-like [Acanthaster planci]
MTATSQRVREKTGEWSSIFPPEQISETQSALFIKKLLAVAVSNIMYLRTIFPEHAFGDRCLEDLNLKILRDDSACPGACQVIKWVKGCFDALDKKYLRALTIGIYVDPDEPDTVIESYTFKFSYQGEGIQIYRNDKKIAGATTEAETKKATTRLLRTIVVLTQSLKSLPDDVIMTMKLLYYDDVTPADYEPPGFQPAETDSFHFEEEPMNIRVGDVSTSFHTVKLRIKTDRKQFELREDNEKDEEDVVAMETDKQDVVSNSALDGEDTDEEPTAKPADTNPQQDSDDEEESLTQRKTSKSSQAAELAKCDVPISSPHRPDKVDEASTPASSSSSNMPFMNEEQEENVVRCPCGCNEDDGLMIRCEECKQWQHAVCFAIISEDQAPEKHICDQCVKITPRHLKPTDPHLTGLAPVVLQATCLWRRALLAATETNRILVPSFSRRLGVEMTVAHGLVNRLEKEGYCQNASKGKRLGKVVNKEKLQKEGLKKYFERKTSNDVPTKKSDEAKPSSEMPRNQKAASQKGKRKVTQVDKLAEQTAELTMTSRLRPRQTSHQDFPPKPSSSQRAATSSTPKSSSSQQSKKRDVGKGKVSHKRAVPLNDDRYDFELSSSQDPDHQELGASGRKRHKSSIVTRTVVV